MNDEASFLKAMQDNPEDNALRLVFADWLEERGDSRGELIRLLHTLTQSIEVPDRGKLENRLRGLLASGVQPVGPFWTNSLGMKFAWIPAGTFLMGSPEDEEGREFHKQVRETRHLVTLTKAVCLATSPVTQDCWQKVMGNNPSEYRGDNLPVERVSWEDCQRFLKKLSDQDGHSYRFPTEAEWEYACRAGTRTAFFYGATISSIQANYDGNWTYGVGQKGLSWEKTTPVGTFPPNAWGVYDMHGNVSEWCADWSGEYPSGKSVDPQGPETGVYRVIRGGWFGQPPKNVRAACRNGGHPNYSADYIGFRPAKSLS